MDTLTSMAIFAEVVNADSFSAAARKLGRSKSSISKHVSALEAHLGVRLLNRTTRQLSLTEAGAIFHDQAMRVVAEADAAEALVTELHTEPRGLLKVNAPVDFGRDHLAPVLPAFLKDHPAISIDLTLNDRYVDLVEEGFDLAVRIAQLQDSTLVARKLAENRLVICAAPAYLKANGTPQTPQELAHHSCLIYSYATAPLEWRFVGPDGRRRKVRVAGRFVSNNGGAMRAVLLGGGGIIAAPEFLVGRDVREGRLRPILTEYSWGGSSGVYAVYPQNRFVSTKVRAFIAHLVAAFGPIAPWNATEEPSSKQ